MTDLRTLRALAAGLNQEAGKASREGKELLAEVLTGLSVAHYEAADELEAEYRASCGGRDTCLCGAESPVRGQRCANCRRLHA